MSKQDRTHSRTPADTESKFLLNLGKSFAEILGIATDARTMADNTRSALSQSVAKINTELADKGATIKLLVDSGIVDKDGKVQASIIISAINDESEAKIKANNIVFEGQKLNIKVDATNIDGKVTADKINANDMILEKATIGSWHLGQVDIPINANTADDIKDEYALYSDELTETRMDSQGVERIYTYRVYLTAKGVYVCGRYNTAEVSGNAYYSRGTWLGLLEESNAEIPSETWIFVLEDGTTVEKEVCIK